MASCTSNYSKGKFNQCPVVLPTIPKVNSINPVVLPTIPKVNSISPVVLPAIPKVDSINGLVYFQLFQR